MKLEKVQIISKLTIESKKLGGEENAQDCMVFTVAIPWKNSLDVALLVQLTHCTDLDLDIKAFREAPAQQSLFDNQPDKTTAERAAEALAARDKPAGEPIVKKCPDCQDSVDGENCPTCEGTGYIQADTEVGAAPDSPATISCEACNGSGGDDETGCASCGGTGQIPDPEAAARHEAVTEMVETITGQEEGEAPVAESGGKRSRLKHFHGEIETSQYAVRAKTKKDAYKLLAASDPVIAENLTFKKFDEDFGHMPSSSVPKDQQTTEPAIFYYEPAASIWMRRLQQEPQVEADQPEERQAEAEAPDNILPFEPTGEDEDDDGPAPGNRVGDSEPTSNPARVRRARRPRAAVQA